MSTMPVGPVIDVRVVFESDWHIGSGTSEPGGVDRLVLRDGEGLPFVPAKTLTGIIRDACEELAQGLDAGSSSVWSAWVRWLFGGVFPGGEARPSAAAVAIGPARFSPAVRAAIAGEPLLTAATTCTRGSTALDPLTKIARKDTLRVVELGRAGAALTTRIRCVGGGPLPNEAAFLLLGAISRVRAIGGMRRRGIGRCRLRTVHDLGPWIDWAREQGQFASPPARQPDLPAVPLSPAPAPGGEWWEVPLAIELRQPVAAQSARKGNVLESYDFVPGTTLLPVVLRCLAADLRSAVAAGDVQVSDAVPALDGAVVVRPPLCLSRAKEVAEAPLRNRLRVGAGEGQEVAHRGGWLAPQRAHEQGVTAHLVHARTEVRMHAVVDDASQRPTAEGGGLFLREALVAGQRLSATVRMRQPVKERLDQERPEWHSSLSTECQLGTSSKDDYGEVVLLAKPARPLRFVPRRDADDGDAVSEFTVMALSELLLRDERLRPDPSIERLVCTLAERLGTTLSVRRSGSADPLAPSGPLDAVTQVHRRESWQRTWGLPRPSLVGLAAGTVAVMRSDPPVTRRRLWELSCAGVGERRAEGFGRLVFDPWWLAVDELVPVGDDDMVSADGGSSPQPAVDPVLTVEEQEFVVVVQRAVWRTAITERAWVAAANEAWSTSGLSRTQLGALREVAASLARDGDFSSAKRWVAAVKGNAQRQRAWGHTRLWERVAGDGKRPGLFQDPEQVWEHLGLDREPLPVTDPAIAHVLRTELQPEACSQLLLCAIRFAMDHNGRQDENGGGDDGA